MAINVNKRVYNTSDIKERIVDAVDTLVDPIRHTISPKGSNVNFIDDNGEIKNTNDGVTIAKSISLSDPVADSIINILRYASLKTNLEAGDGTSTTALLSQTLIKGGLDLIDKGWNRVMLTKQFEDFGDRLIKSLDKMKKKVKGNKDIEYIARVSSNNDPEIAKNIIKVIETAGEDGMIFIEPNKKDTTELVEDKGFLVRSGILSPELRTGQQFSVTYENIPVLVTDKKIYYHEEAATILNTALEAGFKSVAIVATDFIGQALNTLIANHTKGIINVLLIKEGNVENLQDLATYLGADVVTDKVGMLIGNIKIGSFATAKKVFSDPHKTLFSANTELVGILHKKRLEDRITALRDELKKDKNNDNLKERLASLTNGMVTIKVGGATPIEVNERIFRYEDAVNASRSALKYGYLTGGGVSILTAARGILDYPKELNKLFTAYAEANLRQILENCGVSNKKNIFGGGPTEIIVNMSGHGYGYNAMTGKTEDLLKAGVIDPYKVTEMAIRNSISVSNAIISSRYLIVHE